MELMRNWPSIRAFFKRCFFCVVATCAEDGTPHVSPIGSLYLRDDGTGYYFEIFTQKSRQNLQAQPRLCVVGLNVSLWFWVRSLFKGRFDEPPAVRIVGTAMERRPATPEEVERMHRRLRRLRWLKGYGLLWGGLTHVREVRFDASEPVRIGRMTAGLSA